MKEKLLNSSIKQHLGAFPNTLLFGNAIQHEPSISEELEQAQNSATPVFIRAYVDAFRQRQGKFLSTAMRSHEAINVRNLRKRYANYKTGLTTLSLLRRLRLKVSGGKQRREMWKVYYAKECTSDT